MLERRIPPLALTALMAALMSAVALTWPGTSVAFAGHKAIAVMLGGTGIAIAIAGVHAFRRAGTTVNPMSIDRGTSLVTAGIYRFSRNPMYLGFLLLLGGVVAWWASPIAAIGLPLFVAYMNHYQIWPEEHWLHQRYGVAFSDYCSRVRRWF